MVDKVRWGILSTANIALAKVIPAMQRSSWCEITSIASRDLSRAKDAARALQIPNACGSYEELLADKAVEAIYNPLPNHLHVPWTIRAATRIAGDSSPACAYVGAAAIASDPRHIKLTDSDNPALRPLWSA